MHLKSSQSSDHFDPDQYRSDIQELNLTKDQEDELLQALWNIMTMMVDVGWGVESINLILPDIFNEKCQDSRHVVNIKDSRKDDTNDK